MRIRRYLIAAFTAAAVTLSSCADIKQEKLDAHEDVYFSWWGTDLRSDYTLEALREFEDLNKNIDVIPEYCERSIYHRRLEVEIVSGVGADVMQVELNGLYKYSHDGSGFYDLYELSDLISLDNFSQEDLECGTIDGRLNGIPISMETVTFYYDREMYRSYGMDIPETWEELFAAAEAMSPDGIYPLETDGSGLWLMSLAYVQQTFGTDMVMDGAVQYTEEDLEQAFEFAGSLLSSGAVRLTEESGRMDIENSAGAAYWTYEARYFCRQAESQGRSITVGKYLTAEGSELCGWYYRPAGLYCIKKDTSAPENAARLVEFLLNSEEMSSKQGLERGVPLSRSALEVLEANDLLEGITFEADKVFRESRDKLECTGAIVSAPELSEAFAKCVESILYNEGDVAFAAEEIVELSDRLTAERQAFG